MDETKPLLSICIPTYNRASFLEIILEKIGEACKEHDVQVYISDNASTDNTEEVAKQYLARYDFFHYHRHQTNIGPDDNFEYVLKMPTSKYRWLMADASYVENIDQVVADLSQKEYDAYILNAQEYRARYLPKDRQVYDNSIKLMEDIGWHLTWISCMIYNKNLVNSLNFERYKKSSFNQTALIFETTANRPCLIEFNPHMVVKAVPTQKESAWHYHVFDVFYRQWYMFIMSLPLYYPYESKMKCIKDNPKNVLALKFRYQLKRGIEGKWSARDLYENRFFVKVADGQYHRLMCVGLLPKWGKQLVLLGYRAINKSLIIAGLAKP